MLPKNSVSKGFKNQIKSGCAERELVRFYLSNKIESATMVANALDIPRPNMTRHKARLQQLNQLRVVGMGICKITGRKVEFITCIKNVLITRPDEINKA
jgi:hypothetical protein